MICHSQMTVLSGKPTVFRLVEVCWYSIRIFAIFLLVCVVLSLKSNFTVAKVCAELDRSDSGEEGKSCECSEEESCDSVADRLQVG